jgi:hypothetical protein
MFTFSGEIWIFQGKNNWFFVSLPLDVTEDALDLVSNNLNGFNSVKVDVACNGVYWRTSMFMYKKVFILPLRKSIRTELESKSIACKEGDKLNISFNIVL